MGPVLSTVVYVTIWWTVFLCILPIGVVSHAEAGIKTPGGGDPASPVDPKLKRKLVTTTWVAAIPFALVWLAVFFHVIGLPKLPHGG